jgi:hypothetical protein
MGSNQAIEMGTRLPSASEPYYSNGPLLFILRERPAGKGPTESDLEGLMKAPPP